MRDVSLELPTNCVAYSLAYNMLKAFKLDGFLSNIKAYFESQVGEGCFLFHCGYWSELQE